MSAFQVVVQQFVFKMLCSVQNIARVHYAANAAGRVASGSGLFCTEHSDQQGVYDVASTGARRGTSAALARQLTKTTIALSPEQRAYSGIFLPLKYTRRIKRTVCP